MNCRVMVLGSCVSRDAFNFDEKPNFELVKYCARTSLASCFSGKTFKGVSLERIESVFQRKMVKFDIEKSLPTLIKKTDFDILLLDLIDERFNLFIDNLDGSICTLSNELLRSGFQPSNRSGKIIRSGSQLFMEQWLIGWNKLVAELEQNGQLNKLCINEVYWALVSSDGMDYSPNYTEHAINEANELLSKQYAIMRKTLPASNFLSFKKSIFIGDSEHRWGRSPFHYSKAYYQQLLDKVYRYHNSILKPGNIKDKCQNKKAKELNNSIYMLKTENGLQAKPEAFLHNNEVRAKCIMVPENYNTTELTFAFYLLVNGKKVDTRWYEKTNKVNFTTKEKNNLEVVFFIKDEHAIIFNVKIPVMPN